MKKRGISFALLLAAVFTMLMAFTVFAADLALSSEATTVYKGQKITLSAQYKGSGIKATSAKWKTSNKKIATVTKKGVVKGVKAGKATITCTYKNVKAKCVVTVKNPVTSIDVKTSAVKITTTGGKNQATVNIGKTVPLKVYYVTKTNKTTTKQVAASKCKFKSNKTSVAKVSKAGKITAKKAGNAVITVTYKKKSYKLYVTVKKLGSATPAVTPTPTHPVSTFAEDSGNIYAMVCGDCGKKFYSEENWWDTCVVPEQELERTDPDAWKEKHPYGIYYVGQFIESDYSAFYNYSIVFYGPNESFARLVQELTNPGGSVGNDFDDDYTAYVTSNGVLTPVSADDSVSRVLSTYGNSFYIFLYDRSDGSMVGQYLFHVDTSKNHIMITD